MTASIDDTDERSARSFEDRVLIAAVSAVIVPFVVATVRALRNGWIPIGDNAYFLVRARDVLTSHHPLLGTWTSASTNTSTNFNNPGPLLFDLWALPAKLFGGPGLAIGAASLNVAAVVGIAVVVRRRVGAVGATVTMLAVGLLAWTIGSELLFDPWQPHSLLFPFFFFLVAAWAFAAGDLVLAPWALGVGSLVVQTHLSYLILVTAVGLWATAAHLWSRRAPSTAATRPPPRLGRVALALGLVFAVCWGQALVEQVTADGQGNLTRLATNGSSTGPTVGLRTGTQVVADTIAVPPFWLKPSFAEALRTDGGLSAQLDSVDAGFRVSAALMGTLVGVLVLAGALALRRGDRDATAGLGTAVVALGAGLVTASSLPYGIFGLAAHQFRWMWPVGAFTTAVVLVALLRRFFITERVRRIGSGVLLAGVVLVAAVTIPSHNVEAGPSADAAVIPTVRAMAAQMGVFEGLGPILISLRNIRFGEPYSGPVMAELQRRGIPFVFDDEGLVRQMGDARRRDGPAQLLIFREGDAASTTPAGAERMVYVPGLRPAQDAERGDLHRRIVDHLVEVGVTVTDGAVLRGTPVRPSDLPVPGDRTGIERLVSAGTFADLVDAGLVVDDGPWPETYRRWQSLEHRWQTRTIGLFLTPAPTEPIR